MKLGKLLTVTVLTTGVALGTFIKSAEARGSERYSRSSDIPAFFFTLIEQVDLNNDDYSGLFLGAVDEFKYDGYFKNDVTKEVYFSFDGNLKSKLSGNIVTYTVAPNTSFDVFEDQSMSTLIRLLSGLAPYDVYTFDLNFNSTNLTQSQIKDNYVNSLNWLNNNDLPGLPDLLVDEKIILIDENNSQFELKLPSPALACTEEDDNGMMVPSDKKPESGFCVTRKEIPDPVTTPESSATNSLLTLAIVSLGILKKLPHNS